MRKQSHEAVARELARILHLSEDRVLLGARLPDMDNYIGRHRKTLHNPVVLALTTLFDPAVFVGFASHLILDVFPTKFERLAKALGDFVG
ncbi:MAG: hypothetical protein QXK47_04100 [Candidatus Bathyarchaeia archaeon]